ncbi:MAG TPA: TIGR03067 domain-containing protein [Pirellulales bacterium]|jgi:uncharacterized protein (TIGR03067 family)
MLANVLLLSFVVGTAPAAVAQDDASAADLAKMQGDWMVASMTTSGTKLADDEAQILFRTVAGDKYTVSRFTKVVGQGVFKIDATKELKKIDSAPAGQNDQAKMILGIYEFDGARLKICNASPGKPRPVNFDAQFGSGHTSIVWEPEKK